MGKPSYSARRCSFEGLESRQMMAGDVFARIDHGNLIIRGDNADNGIQILAGAAPGEVVVLGTQVFGIGTRVNGVEGADVPLTGFNGRIDIALNGGSDRVRIESFTSRGITADLGRGTENRFELYNHAINGDLSVKSLEGNDLVTLNDNTLSGSISVDMGDGSNSLTAKNDSVGRDAKFVGGRGSDSVLLQNFTAIGNITSSLGDGTNDVDALNIGANCVVYTGGKNNDSFYMEAGDVHSVTANMGQGDNKVDLHGPRIRGDLRVTGGSGIDDVVGDENYVDGSAYIDVGDGSNSLHFQMNVAGDLTFRGGRGADTVDLNGQYVPPVLYRSLKVDLGDGTNSLTANELSTRGRAEVRGGKNSDTINLSSTAFDSFFADLGNGANTFNLSSGTVNRSFELRTGAGSDTGQISGTTITGSTLVNLGDGDNGTFTLQHSTFQADVTFQGGKGADFLVLYDTHVLRSLKANFGGGANRTSVLSLTVDGRADFIGGSGVDSFEIVAITAATLNVAMGKGNDTLMLGFSTTTQSTRIDGEDGKDTYLVGDAGTNTLAAFNSRSFETVGTFHPA